VSPRIIPVSFFEPTGTATAGDSHEAVPGHVDATTGHALGPA
jgi:hypothetical protein